MNTLRITVLVGVVAALAFGLLWFVCERPGRSPAPDRDGWGMGPSVVARDGRTYRPAWRPDSVAVAREDGDGNSLEDTPRTIVAEGRADSACRHVVVISPGGKQSDCLVETADGTLVVLSGGESCLAYEPGTGRLIQGDAIAGISPFLLIGPSDQVPDDALKALEGKAAEARDDRSAIGWIAPSDDVLVKEIGSPNASVRDAARRVARAGGEARYPKASRLR